MPRFYCSIPLSIGLQLDLPSGAARHVQVLRMQPEMMITLFDGLGGEYAAAIQSMGRSSVAVQITEHYLIEREAALAVHLALGVPANERMDWLVEKATELGVASIQPLMTERGVLRLTGERAEKKQHHWQAIAHAACEQSGRNRIPQIHVVKSLGEYLDEQKIAAHKDARHIILSLQTNSTVLVQAIRSKACEAIYVLSGAEGGLSATEESKALTAGYEPVTLGNRVLRAETAAIAALATLVTLTTV